MNESFITKVDSKALHGIAILMMIFHHCFLNPARLNNEYVSILGTYDWVETRISWTGKLCVAVYAFISGYALSKWSKSEEALSIYNRYKKSIGQLYKFYRQFWLVFLVYVPIGIIFFDKDVSVKLIIRGLLFGEFYSGEWWYVKQYVVFMVIFPIFDVIVSWVEKESKIKVMVYGSVGVLGIAILRLKFWDTIIASMFIWFVNRFAGNYMYIFLIAYLLARYNVYENISENISLKLSTPRDKMGGRFQVYLVITIALLVLRTVYVKNPSQSGCDVILTPLLIFFVVNLLNTSFAKRYIVNPLCFLGRYSTFMWLTHTFYIYNYYWLFQRIGLLPKYSILIYLWVLLIALLNGVIFNQLLCMIDKMKDVIFCRLNYSFMRRKID